MQQSRTGVHPSTPSVYTRLRVGASWRHDGALAFFLGMELLFVPGVVQAVTPIVTDGRTATTVSTIANVTTVTTQTLSNTNAFNSFKTFGVASGTVTNLVVPSGANNLINLVSDQRTDVYGMLNAIKDGKVGGNVWFVNPNGFLIGASGVVNVGSLNLSTPTVAFANGFFQLPGTPDAASVTQLLNRTEPRNNAASIVVDGKINALEGIALGAGTVSVSAGGALFSGAHFVSNTPDFSDVVNNNGIAVTNGVVVAGGRILIVADQDVAVSGSLVALDGDVSLSATQAQGGKASITLSQATVKGTSVHLQASSERVDLAPAAGVLSGVDTSEAQASIVVDSSSIEASQGAISLDATARINVAATSYIPVAVLRSNASASVDVKGSSHLSTTGGNASLSATSEVSSRATPTSTQLQLAGDAMVAVSKVNSDASVHLGGTTIANIDGTLSLGTRNTVVTQQVADALASGTGSSGGAVVALSIIHASSTATVDGQADIASAKGLDISAQSTNTAELTARAAAQGAEQDAAGSSQSAQTLKSYEADTNTGDSGSSGSGVKVAGAVAVSDLVNTTLATIASSTLAHIAGAATLSSAATNSASITADASTASGKAGVAVAVGVNLAKSSNLANVAQNLSAQSLHVSALMAPGSALNQFSTTVSSGASGSGKVGIAGAVAVNALDLSSMASLASGVDVNIAAGDSGKVVLLAENFSSSSAAATPGAAITGGAKLGVGASVATNVVSNRAVAQLGSDATLENATGLSLGASGQDLVTTSAEAGSTGGVSITPVAAINLVHNTTSALIASGTTLVVNGDVVLQAEQTASTTATATGSTQGSDAAIGAAVAVNQVVDTVRASTARSIDTSQAVFGGAVGFVANGASTSSASAVAGATGGNADDTAGQTDAGTGQQQDASVDDKVGKQMGAGSSVQQSNGVGDSAEQSSSSQDAADKPSASTSEGKLSVAAAVSVNLQTSSAMATVPAAANLGDLFIHAKGALTLSASNNTDGAASADGNTVGSTAKVGIGAGVAINLVKSRNEASIGSKAQVTASGVALEAVMTQLTQQDGSSDLANTLAATAKSGAGAGKVGLAGSLALNIADTSSQAVIYSGAEVAAGSGALSLHAIDTTQVSGQAVPADAGGVTSGNLGIGASVNVNIIANRATAELQDAATLTGSGSVDLYAEGTYAVGAEAEAGAAGGIAVTPALALNMVSNSTTARLGTGTALQGSAAVAVVAKQSSSTTTSAKGSAQGEKAAIGAAVGIVLLNDVTTASVERNIQSTGAVTVSAQSSSASTNTASASAMGGKSTEEADGGSEDASVDDKIGKQLGSAEATQSSSNVGSQDQKSSTSSAGAGKKSASSDEGKVAVAAAVAVNIVSSKTSAKIADGLTVQAGAALALSATSNTDSSAISDGTTVGSTAKVGIGAAVSVNQVAATNEASIGQNAHITAQGASLAATMNVIPADATNPVDSTNTIRAEARSGAGSGKVGIAASLALNLGSTSSQALVSDGATVDVGGALGLSAQDNSKYVAIAAPVESPDPATGSSSGKVGLGASVAMNLVTSVSRARIGSDTQVSNASDITLSASTQSDTQTDATAGGTAGKMAFDAAVAVATLQQTTDASIASGSDPILASGNVDLSATSSGSHTATTAGTAKAGSVAVGAAVGVITSDSTTTASLDRDVSAGGNLDLTATSDRAYDATATASAGGSQAEDTYTQNKSQADSSTSSKALQGNQNSTTNQGTSGKSKVNVAAAAGVVAIADQVSAAVTAGHTVHSGTASPAGSMAITAINHSNFSAHGSGEAVDATAKVGIAVGVGIAIVNNSTSASIGAGSQVQSPGGLALQALSTQNTQGAYRTRMAAEGLAGAGGSKVGVAGAFAVVDSNAETRAEVGADSVIASGAVSIDADNTSNLSAKAWAGSTGQVGVGAAVATVISSNHYTAALGAGTQVTGSSLDITATNHKFSPTPFSLDLGNLADLSDADSIKAKIVGSGSLTDQLAQGKLLGGGNYYTEAAAGSAGDKVAVAGAFAVSVFEDVTEASIGAGATVDVGAGALKLGSSNDTVARSLAGGIGAGGKVGVGISSSDVASTNVTRSHIDAGVTVTHAGSIAVDASNKLDVEVVGIAAGVAQNVGVGGVATVITLDNQVEAFVAHSGTTVLNTSGAFEAVATNTIVGLNIATGLSAAGTVGVGAVAAVNTVGTDAGHQFTTHAYVGDGVTLNADGHASVTATAAEDLTTFAIAGAVGGSAAVGGAAVANVLNTDTRAYLGANAKLNQSNVLFGQGVALAASDSTDLLNVVVGVAASGSAGVGASADVDIITKTTQASVGTGAWVGTLGNFEAKAASTEDFSSFAMGLGLGGSAGLAGSAAVYAVSPTTLASLGDNATLRAFGSAVIAADDSSALNLVAGSVAGGGSAAIGAAVGLSVFDKVTRASVGDGANVDVLGNGNAVSAENGDMAIQFGALVAGSGQVQSQDVKPQAAASATPPSNTIGKRNAMQGLTGTRSATPVSTGLQGLAVTASNRDKVESFSVTGAAGGSAAVTLGGNVAVLNTDTEASLGASAKINQQSIGQANAAQSVRLAAGSDQYHLGLAGAASAGGAAAIGAGADVVVASNTVKALIQANAQVKAQRDVQVLAHGQEQFFEMGAGLSAASSVAIAGSVSVISISDTTYARIEGGTGTTTQVQAGGNVQVVAADDTEADLVAGAAAAGFGVAGFGVAVGVSSINKDTQASVGDYAVVSAAGNNAAAAFLGFVPGSALGVASESTQAAMHGLQVQATSSEDLFEVSASGAGGLYVAASGAVTVSTVNSNTRAAIGDHAQINTANASGQDVNVTARNVLTSEVFTGSAAVGGLGGGLAGGFDVFTAKNNTQASIGNDAQVFAGRDVLVNALSDATLSSTSISASGALLAGIAGGVSVYSVGDKLGADAQSRLESGGNARSEADSQAQDSTVTGLLSGSSDARVSATSNRAQALRAAVSTDSASSGTPAAGNTASIGSNTAVLAHRNIAVNARGNLDFDAKAGAASAGALGLGAGIGIANFSLNNRASIGASSALTADADVSVRASLDESAKSLAFAGSFGIVAADAAVSSLSDNGVTSASLGSGVQVHKAANVVVDASDVRTLQAQSLGASAGALAVGASVAETDIQGSTSAHVGAGSNIGGGLQDAVGSLRVSADSRDNATSSTMAAAGGLSAAASGSAATATVAPVVSAYVDDGSTVTLSGQATVQARAAVGASADAEGVNVSGGVAIGASVALANAQPQVSAYLGKNTRLSASGLDVTATQALPDSLIGFDHLLRTQTVHGVSVLARASGASGGVLAGVVATEAEANFGSVGTPVSVTAQVGDGSILNVSGALDVKASDTSSQQAESTGLALGFVALGSNDAFARSNTSTLASLGSNVVVAGANVGGTQQMAGQLAIEALGSDTNRAASVSGTGGIVAGSAASANTFEKSNTVASIADSSCGDATFSCGIMTDDFRMEANHTTDYNSKVDSTQASLAGASGAINSHSVDSVVQVNVGADTNVTAGSAALDATNATHKFWWGQSTDADSNAIADAADWNVNSGSGGLLNLPAGSTQTTLKQQTAVNVGHDALFHITLPASGVGAFSIDANNAIVYYDKTKLDSGGAIALAESRTVLNAGTDATPISANVNLADNARVSADSGDINIGSHTDAQIDVRAVANAYGLAGAPSGQAYIYYTGKDTTSLAANALLLAVDAAHGAINVSAGENSAQQASAIRAHSAVNLWNKTAVPIDTTPDAQTIVKQDDKVSLAATSNILAAGDIGLNADRGAIDVSAVGVGKDLYREVIGAIASAVGIDASLDIKGGYAPSPSGQAQVDVNGSVLSGLLRKSATQIDAVVQSPTFDANGVLTSVSWSVTYAPIASAGNAALALDPNSGSATSPSNPYITYVSEANGVTNTQVDSGSLLQARLNLLRDLQKQYAADPVANAAYASEISFIVAKLGSQGIGQTSSPLTQRGAAALDAAGSASDVLISRDATQPAAQALITGDFAASSTAGQIGAVGQLKNDYASIVKNDSDILVDLLALSNTPANLTTPTVSAYESLKTNTTLADKRFIDLKDAATSIGNLAYQVETTTPGTYQQVAGTGYLGQTQSAMRNIGVLALSRTATTGIGDLSSNVSLLANNLGFIRDADIALLSATNDIYTSLKQVWTDQGSLATAWGNTSNDTQRLTAITGFRGTNHPTTGLLSHFDVATAGSAASVISTNTALVTTAASTVADSARTVPGLSNAPPSPGQQTQLTLPDIAVKLGNVNVKADVLSGTGSLKAPGDAKIWILNHSPASMQIGNLTVDASGGNVRLDGFLINSREDILRFNPSYTGATPSIVSRENGLAGAPEIRITSTYDPGAICLTDCTGVTEAALLIPAQAPDLTLGYRTNATENTKVVSNPNGSVNVRSAAGDIFVDGSITAGSVSIQADNGDFVQQYVNGFDSVAGDPSNNVQGGAGVLAPGNSTQPGKGIVANGNVFISARYLNINGLVQSGIADYQLNIPAEADMRFTKFADRGNPNATQYTLAQVNTPGSTDTFDLVLADGSGTTPSTTFTAIGATYVANSGVITMASSVAVHGGNITLFGQIFNTADGASGGTGQLNVLDGFGQISVTNNSNMQVALKSLDTGADPGNTGRGSVGIIDITDVQGVRVVTDAATGKQVATMDAIHTVISRDQGKMTVQQTGYWNTDGSFNTGELSSFATGASALNAAQRVTTDLTPAVGGRSGAYDPQAGLRYVYTNGKDTSTEYTWRIKGPSFLGSNSLNLAPTGKDVSRTSGPDVLSNAPLDNGIYMSYTAPVGTTTHANGLSQDVAMTGSSLAPGSVSHTSTEANVGLAVTHKTADVYTLTDQWNNCNWWTLCILSDYTQIWNEKVAATTVTTNSVKADYPIQIHFLGADTASLTVTSKNAPVTLLQGSLLNNRNGDASFDVKGLNASGGSLIDTKNLAITSQGSVGSDGAPLKVRLSGALTAAVSNGNLAVNAVNGALKVARVSATGDSVLGTGGRVVLKAQDDVYGDVGNLVSGERIEITSANGAIGGIAGNANAHEALNVAPGYTADLGSQRFYGLKAEAAGDIGIDVQTSNPDNTAGHLLVDQVVSHGGNVQLKAPGQILDNNPDFTIDSRNWSELLGFWGSVNLQADAANAAKVEKALQAYEAGRTAQYVLQAGQVPGLDAQALARGQYAAVLKAANPGWTVAQVDTQVLAAEAAGTLPTPSSNPKAGFVYVASAAERAAQSQGSTWTDTQLAVGLNPGLLKNITDTNPVIKKANVSGRKVSLVAGMSIGSTLPSSSPEAVVINIAQANAHPENLTDKEKVALATAEFSDFDFSVPGQLTIRQRLPVNFDASQGLSATVRENADPAGLLTAHIKDTDLGNAYLATLGKAYVKSISVDGELRLKAKGSIYAVDPAQTSITAGDLILEASNGSIGGNEAGSSPLRVRVVTDRNATTDSYGSLTARASGAVNLEETGDMAIGGIFSRDAITVTSLTGSVLNAHPQTNTGLVLLGGTVDLSAPEGSIGDIAGDAPVAVGSNVGTPLSGLIQAQARDTVYLKGPVKVGVGSNFDLGPVDGAGDAISAGGEVKLLAEGNASIHGRVVTNGDVDINVAGTLTLDGPLVVPAAAIHTTAGNVRIVANSLVMQDQATLRADLGTIRFDTVDDAIITGISTDNATAQAVIGNSSNGRILDGGDTALDVQANQAGAGMALTAQKGVGTAKVRADGSIDSSATDALELDVANVQGIAITGGLNMTSQGLLTVSSATAPGDIVLSGAAGVVANVVSSAGGSVNINSANGGIVVQSVQSPTSVTLTAKQGIQAAAIHSGGFVGLSGSDISATVFNDSANGMQAAVSGPDGSAAQSVDLELVNPNAIVFNGFHADVAQLRVVGQGSVAVAGGVVGTRMTVSNPSTTLVIDSRNNGLEDADVKLYAPLHDVNFQLQGTHVVTSNFVLEKKPEFMTDGPGGRDVTVVDMIVKELAKVQVRPGPQAPMASAGFAGQPVQYSGMPMQLEGDALSPPVFTDPSKTEPEVSIP